MYRLVQKLDDGIWYNPVFFDRFLITNKKDKTVRVYETDALNEVKILFPNDITYITHHENNLFISSETDTFLFDVKDLSKKGVKMAGVHVLPAFINDQFIFSNYQTDSGLKIVRYNYKNLSLEEFFDYQIGRDTLGVDNKLVFTEKNFISRKIFCIDQGTGKKCWELDVSEIGQTVSNGKEAKGKIVGSLMAKNEGLLVAISNSKLIKIDTNSGNLTWERDSTNHLLQLYGDRIINVDAGYYREISPDTGKTLVEYEMNSEYVKHGFTATGPLGAFTVMDTHVFIVHAMGCKMGCINRCTGKIDWSVEVGEGIVTLPHAPIVYKDKLYVLDDEGTLHVYVRELFTEPASSASCLAASF